MDEPPETNQSLIARIKNTADAESWSEFVAIYGPIIERLAVRRGLQQADAQDISQKVLWAVSKAIGRWEPLREQQPFRAWLGKIAHNAILNALSRRRPDMGSGLSAVAEQLNEIAAQDPGTTAELLQETQRELFRRVAQQIRPEFTSTTWSMFWETEVNGRSVTDVATSLGRTTGAVYVARSRVMNRLRVQAQAAMAGWGVESPGK